jgi:hypothetical protein
MPNAYDALVNRFILNPPRAPPLSPPPIVYYLRHLRLPPLSPN